MIDPRFASLCALLRTKDRMHAFVSSLDEIIAKQSQSESFSLPDALFTREEYKLVKELVKDFSDLKNLRKQVFEVPVFSLQIAFIPTKQFILKIINSIQESNHDPLLVDIIVNPGIIGGVVIEFKGMYADKSLKKDITQWMKVRGSRYGR